MNADPEKREAQNEEAQAQAQRWAEAAKRAAALRGKRTAGNGQPVRSINEDDDGYDPYSDFHDRRTEEPFFQKDPWM